MKALEITKIAKEKPDASAITGLSADYGTSDFNGINIKDQLKLVNGEAE